MLDSKRRVSLSNFWQRSTQIKATTYFLGDKRKGRKVVGLSICKISIFAAFTGPDIAREGVTMTQPLKMSMSIGLIF